ncbi:hypothetical protein GQ53DRAFT_791903 [Thozetella sp. PMI_491]|nr:hypothetical protein GQ53DRAFT_791903 [Thozetella sp. PMI_491]
MASKTLFDVPSGAVAQVHIIDSTVRITGFPAGVVVVPDVDGFDQLPPLGSWSFLIQSSKGQKVLFDLSIPPMDSYPPFLLNMLTKFGVKVETSKHVSDVLKENGMDLAEIGSVIWSHHHWDHIGDITTFPTSVELVIGPGLKQKYLPGYPTNPDSPLPEEYLECAGAFRAHDFFGDGSFFLLDAPGHTTGHLAGLARTTTNPDTFIFMGGDLCHHGGEIRPSPHLQIPAEVQFALPDSIRSRVPVCPGGATFQQLNIKRGRRIDQPFFDPAFAEDMAQTMQTIKDAQEADAQSDVFFVFAHDMAITETVDFFPLPANGWKEKGWREKALWNFLADLTLGATSSV